MKRASIFQRLIFVIIILISLISKDYENASFLILVFTTTAVFIFLAMKDERFWLIDTLVLFLFFISLVIGRMGHPLVPSIYGVDKLYHFAMGLLFGWTGVIILKKHIKDVWIFRLCVICFTCTVATGWEVYEWLTLGPLPIADTMLDIILAIMATVLFLMFVKDDKESQ